MAELQCDVAVVGGGPAGIAAAVAAAEAGAAVVLIDEAPRAGGQIWRHTDEAQLPAHARAMLQRLRRCSAELLSGTSVFDIETTSPFRIHVEQRGTSRFVNARQLILATGARELFLPFPGWTLTGVVGVGGAQALLKSGANLRGRRVLVGGSGPLLFPVAALLSRSGALVVEVLEQAPRARVARFGASLWRTPRRLVEAAVYRRGFARTPYRTGTWVVRAEGSDGVTRAVVSDGARSHTRTIECDLLCVSYGLIPATELARYIGCALNDDGSTHVDELQQTSVAGVLSVGETTGVAGVDAALVEGEIAGLRAAGSRPPRSLLRRARSHAGFVDALARAFAPRDELRNLALPDTIVCRCEDVTWQQIQQCGSMREAKLVTRAGMGPCQGRICGAALRSMNGWTVDQLRTPLLPVSIDSMRQT